MRHNDRTPKYRESMSQATEWGPSLWLPPWYFPDYETPTSVLSFACDSGQPEQAAHFIAVGEEAPRGRGTCPDP